MQTFASVSINHWSYNYNTIEQTNQVQKECHRSQQCLSVLNTQAAPNSAKLIYPVEQLADRRVKCQLTVVAASGAAVAPLSTLSIARPPGQAKCRRRETVDTGAGPITTLHAAQSSPKHNHSAAVFEA